MNTCDEDTAKFMGKSLLNHAREIHRYAKAYCEPSDANEYIDVGRRAKFTGHLERMLKEMYALMLMAKYKGVSRFCNREQIEAYINAAADVIAPAEMSSDLQSLLS